VAALQDQDEGVIYGSTPASWALYHRSILYFVLLEIISSYIFYYWVIWNNIHLFRLFILLESVPT
jgi:hypothetical protein